MPTQISPPLIAALAATVILNAGVLPSFSQTPDIPVRKSEIPSGVYEKLTAADIFRLASKTLSDSDASRTTAVIYLHRLPKGTDIDAVSKTLATKLDDGSVRPVMLPSSADAGAQIFVQAGDDGLTQVKNLKDANHEIGFASFDSQIIPQVNTEPSKWINWDTRATAGK